MEETTYVKIPCIKYNPNTWNYIKEQLESFGYEGIWISSWKSHPYIVINLSGNLGDYSNVSSTEVLCYNREIINNTEEFLERAAKLMNKTYKRKDIMKINGIEIKPGMVIETEERNQKITYVVFPCLDGSLCVIGLQNCIWEDLSTFVNEYSTKIIAIRNLLDGSDCRCLLDGKILWKKQCIKEVSIEEVAEKFGVKPNQIRIKK